MSVIASGIPLITSDDKVKDFFSFCGKVKSVTTTEKEDKTRAVKVVFENSSAVSTALLLNGAELDGSAIKVEEAKDSAAAPVTTTTETLSKDVESAHALKGDIPQELKPKSAIAAEYLANGYILSDHLVQKTIDFDKKHGFSDKFNKFLGSLDEKYHIQDKSQVAQGNLQAKSAQLNTKLEQKFAGLKLDDKLASGKRTFSSYLDKFKNDKYGSKISEFYTGAVTEVSQVHKEALKIASEKSKNLAAQKQQLEQKVGTADGNTEAKPKLSDYSGSAATVNPTINTISPESTTAQAAGAVAFEADKK